MARSRAFGAMAAATIGVTALGWGCGRSVRTCPAEWTLALGRPPAEVPSPLGQTGERAIFDVEGQRMIFLGGSNTTTQQWEHPLWELALPAQGAPTELKFLPQVGSPPSQRIGRAAVYDRSGRRMIVFGGQGIAGYSNQVSELSLPPNETPVWQTIYPSGPAPEPRSSASMVLDEAGRRIILIGGVSLESPTAPLTRHNDVWVLSLADPQMPSWQEVQPIGSRPTLAGFGGAAYDPARRRVILISRGARQVWELALPDGGPATWRRLPSATGGAPSSVGRAEWDVASGRILAFDPESDRGLWALDVPLSGAPAWTRLSDGTPNASPATAMSSDPTLNSVYDSAGRRIVWVKAVDDQIEVWALPIASPTPSWTALWGPAGPSNRSGHSAIHDRANRRVIVFGGNGTRRAPDGSTLSELKNDVHALSLSDAAPRWSAFSTTGTRPLPRQMHSAVYDSDGQRMIVYGGTGPLDDVWALSLPPDGRSVWTALAPAGTPPAGRIGHSAVYDRANRRMIVFGGVVGSGASARRVDETWELSLPSAGAPSWRKLPDGPAARADHAAVVDETGQRMIIYGGTAANGPSYFDVWALSLADPAVPAWSRLEAGEGPGALTLASATFDSSQRRMNVFLANPRPATFEAWALQLTPSGAEWLDLRSTNASAALPSPFNRAIYDEGGQRTILLSSEEGVVVWTLPSRPCP